MCPLRNVRNKFLFNFPIIFHLAQFENFGNKNFFFSSPTVSPIGRREDLPAFLSRKREKERRGTRSRRKKKTKKRSAPHESLIESIHGDSGEEKNRPFRDTNGRRRRAKVCRVVTTRGSSRKRTLKSLILEEEEKEKERRKG